VETPQGRAQTLYFREALLEDGWSANVRLTLRDGLIAAIDCGNPPAGGEERHAVALPGMPNLHSHAFQRGMAGLAEIRNAEHDDFWTWREVMYRFVHRLTPDDVQAIAALAYIEMLECGFTRVGEFHYLHHDCDGRPYANPAETSASIFAAAAETGIALTHLPVFYAHAAFGGEPPKSEHRRFVNDLDSFAILLDAVRRLAASAPDAVVGLAPHSLRAVAPRELAGIEQLVAGGPLHLHIAEQEREVMDCLAWSGARPVEWLLDHAKVDARWCLVHATHISLAEARSMAATGAVAGLCPITEANLGDGIFPAENFLSAGGSYGLGSDSNVLIDMTEEIRLLEYSQRLARRARNVLAAPANPSTADAIYRAALVGGATALGARPGLAVGQPADLVSLDVEHPSLVGRRGPALLDGLIFAAGRSAIQDVWRRGRKVVLAGRHIARGPIVHRYRSVMEKLLS
jgi:formimidoylglutamate deiminase